MIWTCAKNDHDDDDNDNDDDDDDDDDDLHNIMDVWGPGCPICNILIS